MNTKLILSGFGLCIAVGAFAADPTPLSHWKFDDAENVGRDEQGYNPLAPAIASETYDTPQIITGGHSGSCVDLKRWANPVGNALLGAAGEVPTGTNPFTVSAWIRPNSATANSAYIICNLALESGVPEGWTAANRWTGWYLRFGGENKLCLCFGGWRQIPAASDSTDAVGVIPSGAYKDGAWHHVVFSRDANKVVRLYWDGAKIAEQQIAYSVNAICRLLLGSYEKNNFYSGDYDEVKCYDVALTDAQVYREFYAGIAEISDDGRIILNADAGEVVTNEVSYPGGAPIAKTGEGEVRLYHQSSGYKGAVGVTNGLLRLCYWNCFPNATGFAAEDGATMAFGGSANYAAAFAGEGTMRFEGRGAYNLTGDVSAFSGTWANYAANVAFGTAGSPRVPSASSAIDVQGGGFLRFHDDVAVRSLSGEGLLGGVALADGKTLTVAGEADASFAGCLAGKGSLVKNGAGTQTLAGAGAFTNVAVNAGTLALTTVVAGRPTLCAHWNFEDAADVGKDVSPSGGTPLSVDAYGEPTVELVDGVVGKAIHIVEPNATDAACFLLDSADNGGLPSGKQDFTVSFWLRPRGNTSGNCYVMRHSGVLTGSVAETFSSTGWNNGWWITSVKGGKTLFFGPLSGWKDPAQVTAAAFVDVDLTDGRWHHIVGTRRGKTWSLYVDGARNSSYVGGSIFDLSKSNRMQIGSYGCRDQPQNAIDADYDEVKYLEGAWTDEEVAAEFSGTVAHSEMTLPAPIACWTFDEIETDENGRFFRDHSDSGWHFYEVKSGTKAVACIDAAHSCGEGVNGGAAYVDSANGGAYLKVGDHVNPKAVLAAANPDVTLSIRLRNISNTSVGRQVFLSFGSAQAANTCFRLTQETMNQKDWYPHFYRILPGDANNREGWLLEDTCESAGATTPWTTLTFVNAANTKTVTVYRDGREIGTFPTDYKLGLDRILLFAGYNYNTYNGFAVDDLRVYADLLTPVQVRALAYLQAGVKPSPLAAARVTVAADAKLAVDDGNHAAQAVSGAGAVTIGAYGTFAAADWTGFSGTVSGDGCVVLDGTAALGGTVAANVLVKGYTATLAEADGAPRMTTPGRVEVAKTGAIRITDAANVALLNGGFWPLAKGGSYSIPADLSGWTFEPQPEKGWCFVVRNDTLCLRVKGGGTYIIVK